MKKLLLIFLFIPVFCLGQLGGYEDYYNNERTKGLKFQIKKPINFETINGTLIGTVFSLVEKEYYEKTKHCYEDYYFPYLLCDKEIDNSKYVAFTLNIKSYPSQLGTTTTNEWKEIFKTEEGLNFLVSETPNATNYRYFEVDGFPGVIRDYEDYLLGQRTYITNITVIVNWYFFQLSLNSLNKELRDKNKELLIQLSDSILFRFW